MSLKKIAELIPAEYRKEILELNLIGSSQAIAGNKSMEYLIVIWKNYIEKDFREDCNLCRARVLDSFKALQPTLISMEQDSNLLNEV